MPQSLSSILIHLVFSTKNRESFITPAIEREVHPYMATVFRALKSPSLAIDGTTDHVHILFCSDESLRLPTWLKKSKQDHPSGSKRKARPSETFIGRRD